MMNIDGLELILNCFENEIINGSDPLNAMKEAFSLYAEAYTGYKSKNESPTKFIRPVKVFKFDNMKRDPKGNLLTIEDGNGVFHGLGSSYEEFGESRAIQISTAIIEMDDGTVKNVPVELIQFTDVDK